MKLFFDNEDTLIGIAIGVLLISMSGKYIAGIPGKEIILMILCPLGILLAFFDVIHHFSGLSYHFSGYALIILHNLVNIVVLTGILSVLIKFDVPQVSSNAQLVFGNDVYVFGLGIYFIVTYIMHAVSEHMIG